LLREVSLPFLSRIDPMEPWCGHPMIVKRHP
jgi:hypothetical protein